MVDTAFEDFFGSDDDAFFLEASHHLLDGDSATETVLNAENNASKKQSRNNASASFHLDEIQNKVSDAESILLSKECEGTVKKIGLASKLAIKCNAANVSDCSKISAKGSENTIKGILNESRTSSSSSLNDPLHCPQRSSKECDKDDVIDIFPVASTSTECYSKDIIPIASTSTEHSSNNSPYLNKTSVTPDSSSYINSRFTPGFTPKAKKRKLPGPAGLFERKDSKEAVASSSEQIMDMQFENIISSQFSTENLSLISWQKLQTAVSSCPDLHSTVKYYSIQRVLQESSKKKPPKHMVVPFLCVSVKKLSFKGSATISVFMDDTGEINGKIDTEVLSTYKEYLVEGTALILKKVTFLCNMLILKAQNIVSVYHPGGMEKHPQNLDSLLKTSEPLKPMNCECLKLADNNVKDGKHKNYSYTANDHKVGCSNHSQSRFSNTSDQNKILAKLPYNNNTPRTHKPNYANFGQNKLKNVANQNKTVNKTLPSLNAGKSSQVSEDSNHTNSVRSDAFLENLLDEDNCIDEFDELLGNLDEKSFMEDA